ncbi:conserved hypothetical protein, partial [Ricinus communis]
INEMLRKEEILWFKKARVKWNKFNDRNSKFFHSSTLIRTRLLRIFFNAKDVISASASI